VWKALPPRVGVFNDIDNTLCSGVGRGVRRLNDKVRPFRVMTDKERCKGFCNGGGFPASPESKNQGAFIFRLGLKYVFYPTIVCVGRKLIPVYSLVESTKSARRKRAARD
jgi:hypothetical protein